jgi:transcriptional regulator with XRE-family HTH domain
MARNITLAEQMTLLFAYGESRGISAAYRAIATATGENANNIRKIYRGENINPGLRILTALTDYFRVDLAYFNCESRSTCKQYLSDFERQRLIRNMQMGLKGLSEESQEFLRTAFVYARKAEGLPPVD